MAGSFNHVVKDDGSLRKPERVQGSLECTSHDVYEAVEEMYGMIWFLADWVRHAEGDAQGMSIQHKDVIETARLNYKLGLEFSPTKRFQKENS